MVAVVEAVAAVAVASSSSSSTSSYSPCSKTLLPPPHVNPPPTIFPHYLLILRQIGKNKAQARHNSTYVHKCCLSIELTCIRNQALGSVSCSSRGNDSASCPYRRSSLLLQQRKLPLYADTQLCTRSYLVQQDASLGLEPSHTPVQFLTKVNRHRPTQYDVLVALALHSHRGHPGAAGSTR